MNTLYKTITEIYYQKHIITELSLEIRQHKRINRAIRCVEASSPLKGQSYHFNQMFRALRKVRFSKSARDLSLK